MRKSKFTEEQIIGFLKQAEAGLAVAEICRKGGFSDATFYKWRAKFGHGAERIGGQRGLHHRSQAIEALAHVGVSGYQPDRRAGWQAHHQQSPRGQCGIGATLTEFVPR